MTQFKITANLSASKKKKNSFHTYTATSKLLCFTTSRKHRANEPTWFFLTESLYTHSTRSINDVTRPVPGNYIHERDFGRTSTPKVQIVQVPPPQSSSRLKRKIKMLLLRMDNNFLITFCLIIYVFKIDRNHFFPIQILNYRYGENHITS